MPTPNPNPLDSIQYPTNRQQQSHHLNSKTLIRARTPESPETETPAAADSQKTREFGTLKTRSSMSSRGFNPALQKLRLLVQGLFALIQQSPKLQLSVRVSLKGPSGLSMA